MKRWEIEVGKGMGEFKFGMTPDDIYDLVGIADEIINTEFDPNLVVHKHNSIKTSFTFNKSNNLKLQFIRSRYPNLYLNGILVVGISVSEMFQALPEEMTNCWEISNHWVDTQYFIEDWSLAFKEEFGEIHSVEFGPLKLP